MNFLKALVLLFGILWISACASYRELPQDYARLNSNASKSKTDKTVILFLVDGLSSKLLKQELVAGHMPAIDSFFIGSKKEMFIARTEFPSLTFTGIGSLLTERPVSRHGIFGNRVLSGSKIINFEEPQNYSEVNFRIKDKNIFSRLKAKGYSTVSYSYSFYANADVHSDLIDGPAGLSLLNMDYEFSDRKTLDSLTLLLTQNPPQVWPDFIFVHLIGVDFTSHRWGPQADQVLSYLNKLDQELKPVFGILKAMERSKQRKVMALLTADHGFDQIITSRVDLSDLLGPEGKDLPVMNEGRFAGIYFPKEWAAGKRTDYLKKISLSSAVELTAQRQSQQVVIQSATQQTKFIYSKSQCAEGDFAISIATNPPTCPESLNNISNGLYYPYFIANLSHYFEAEAHPDALIIPKSGVSFGKINLGQHGGPTPSETQIPVLIHNGTLTNQKKYPKLYELLRFL